MISRYDFMNESNVKDIDGEVYPDPLSISFNDIQFSKIPEAHRITAPDLDKFWMYMWKAYGRVDLDDILLNINGIPYLGTVNPGELLFKIEQEDLLNFDSQKLINLGGE